MHVISGHMMKYTHVHVCCIQVQCIYNTENCSMVCVYVYMYVDVVGLIDIAGGSAV